MQRNFSILRREKLSHESFALSSKNSRHGASWVARHPKTSESIKMAIAVGSRLRTIRIGLRISQEHLAEIVGVHRTQIGFLERGINTPDISTLAMVARGLGKKASAILDECGY